MKFTTLIPAYKPKYLVELLTALRYQTVKPTKIIVSDDSSERAFINALSTEPLRSTVLDLHIEVVRGPRQGGYNNFRHLLKLYKQDPQRTELFHLLLDDDILYPTFYERHLEAHQITPVPCVVSRRWGAQENGQPITDNLPVPSAIGNHPQRMLALGPEILFPHLVGTSSNWLGEFSNVTFRAGMAPELDDTSLGGISFAGLEDLGAFLKVSLHGSIGYLNEYLGYFRQSANQNSADPMGRPLKLAFLAYVALTIASRKLQRLTLEQSQAAIQKVSSFVLFHYSGEADMRDMCALLPALIRFEPGAEQAFLVAWEQFSQRGPAQPTPETQEAQPQISVVIPVYNGALYLAETLDSLLAQEFRDFEVLCMDDCSTDASLAVLDRYAQQDTRVRVILLDANQGCVPLVLNRALPMMRGRFFAYASQDDLFSTDWLAKMHARAIQTGADAVIPDLTFYYAQEPVRCHTLVGLRGDRNVELTGRQAVEHSLDWTIPGNALWNAELIRQLGCADFSMNADEFSVRVFFLNCNKVVFSEGRFLYRQDNANAITKKITPKSFDTSYTFFRLFLWLRENGFAPELFGREALKAVRSLEQMQQWLATMRDTLSPEQLADAQTRAKRCDTVLREYGLLDLFSSQESTT